MLLIVVVPQLVSTTLTLDNTTLIIFFVLLYLTMPGSLNMRVERRLDNRTVIFFKLGKKEILL